MINLIQMPYRLLRNWGYGLLALLHLLVLLGVSLRGEGSLKDRLGAQFSSPAGLRHATSFVRSFFPNIRLNRRLVQSYRNSATVIVTRRDDVRDVLSRNGDFEVVYESRMRQITAGENFFLGMQPSWLYTRDTSNMRLAMRSDDVATMVLPDARRLADAIVSDAKGALDIPQQLTHKIPTQMVSRYFGVPGPSEEAMVEWTTAMFWYLFSDLGADPEVERKALSAAQESRHYLDALIQRRKASPDEIDDVLGRCLKLQAAGMPGMDDLGIRDNLIGLIIGAIPTLSKASCFALDELLRRPDQLVGACSAAREDDDAQLAQYVQECLRFNPHQPLIYRRANKDCYLAQSTLHQRKVREGDMLLAVTLAASFDPLKIIKPNQFRTDRAASVYMPWGYGLHECFGAAINAAVIPAILKPLLRRENTRRASGKAGQIDGKTPFPQHFAIEFD